jgi:MHS family proline/betaine transporter-like MFS transporter
MTQQELRVMLAAGIGNVMEWYDFGLYGLLAPVLASSFFPSSNRIAALSGVYAGFAIGFAMRPIGAAVLGRLGDRVGRRFVLLVSVILMGISTVAVGLLPTYDAIGIWAPVLMIVTRLFQGFSVGGEFVGSVTYLVESSPAGRRGFAGSIANWGATAGLLSAAGVAAIATEKMESPHVGAWAWRVPFLLGGALTAAAYSARSALPELRHESDASAKSRSRSPLWDAIREEPMVMAAALLFTTGYGIINYLTMAFLPTYAHEFGKVAEYQTLRANTAGQAVALVIVPVSGWISDRFFTRRAILFAMCLAEAAVAWRAFDLARRGGVEGVWMAQLAFALLLAIWMGADPAMLSEQFRPEHRVSAHAVVFNIGIGIFGGTAPIVAVALIRATSNVMAPAAYLIFAAVLSAVGVLALRDRGQAPAN